MIFDMKMFSIDRNIIVVKSEGYESILRHSHNFIEITYVVSGRALHNVGDKTVEVKAGDVFVIATGEEHNIRPVCKEAISKLSISYAATIFLKTRIFLYRIGYSTILT